MTPTPNRKHWSHDVQQLTGVPPRVTSVIDKFESVSGTESMLVADNNVPFVKTIARVTRTATGAMAVPGAGGSKSPTTTMWRSAGHSALTCSRWGKAAASHRATAASLSCRR